VKACPFKDEPKGPRRELAPDDAGFDLDRDLVVAIHRMKVRDPVLVDRAAGQGRLPLRAVRRLMRSTAKVRTSPYSGTNASRYRPPSA